MNTLQFDTIGVDVRGCWVFTWPGALGAVRLILNGTILAETEETEYTYTGPGYEAAPPPIELVPAGQWAMSEENQPFMTLQWYRTECDRYVVEERIDGGEWEAVGTVPNRHGGWVFSYTTQTLVDGVVYEWRVVPINEDLRSGDPLGFLVPVVCPPVFAGVTTVACIGGMLAIS